MIVLDASAAIELVLGSRRGQRVAERIRDPRTTIHVPHLLTVEGAQVLRRLELAGALDAQRASEALDDLCDLDAERYDHEPLLSRAWALRRNLTAYDAVYVALAESLDATLVTFDRRLARAPGTSATVEVLPAR